MTLIPRLQFLIAFVIISLLSGCGFHFRGDYLVPEEIGKISVTSFDEYGTLTRDVKRTLRLNGLDITDPAANVSNLHLISESIGERTLSLYQNSRAAEKELTLYVSYRIVIPNKGMKNFSTQVNRSFLDNPLTALAKSVEREMIEDEMRQQASHQIIRQLARLRTDVENNKETLDKIDPESAKQNEQNSQPAESNESAEENNAVDSSIEVTTESEPTTETTTP